MPVFNSELTLAELATRLSIILPTLSDQYELILVNDASQDGSWAVINKLASQFDWITGINLMRNYGQHNALLCGIRAAQHDVVVTLDDDLQHPPEEMPRLLSKLADGYDVIYGKSVEDHHGFWRNSASQITKLALRSAMGAETARNVSAYRVFFTRLRDAFANYQGPFASIDVLLTWATTRFSAIPVQHNPRYAGVSNYTVRKLVVHALNMMTGFSTLPLQFASLIGFAFTVFGLGVFIYVIVRFFIEGGSVPGFPFLASIIAIFSGAQLFALGVMGEYLARMHFRIMDRPTYVVRSTTFKTIE